MIDDDGGTGGLLTDPAEPGDPLFWTLWALAIYGGPIVWVVLRELRRRRRRS